MGPRCCCCLINPPRGAGKQAIQPTGSTPSSVSSIMELRKDGASNSSLSGSTPRFHRPITDIDCDADLTPIKQAAAVRRGITWREKVRGLLECAGPT